VASTNDTVDAGTTDVESPAYENGAYRRWKHWRKMLADFYGGTHLVWTNAKVYLPQHQAEDPEDYWSRVKASEVFPALSRTIDGVVGIQWRKTPTFDTENSTSALDEKFEADAQDIDGKGNNLAVFCHQWSRWGWLKGIAGILIDYPVTIDAEGNPLVATAKDEKDHSVRPYWVGYSWDDILSATPMMKGAREVLGHLVLRDRTTARLGRFGEQDVTYYRVFTRHPDDTVEVETWRAKGTEKPKLIGQPMKIMGQTEIPFVIIKHGHSLGTCEVQPAFLDMCFTLLAHFRVQSDRRYSLKLTLAPILALIGFPQKTSVIVGSNTSIRVPEGGDIKYVEPSGSALGEARTELQDLLASMASQGLQVLAPDSRAAETATAKRLDREEQVSTVSVVAQAWRDGLGQAWKYHASYYGIESESAPMMNVETDFADVMVDSTQLTMVRDAVTQGLLSVETLWDIWQRAGVLTPDFNPAREIERLAKSLLMEKAFGDEVADPEDENEPPVKPPKKAAPADAPDEDDEADDE